MAKKIRTAKAATVDTTRKRLRVQASQIANIALAHGDLVRRVNQLAKRVDELAARSTGRELE